MFFFGIGVFVLCFVIWNYLVGVFGVVKFSVYIYMVLVIIIIVVILILYENMIWIVFLGGVFIFLGFYILELKLKLKVKLMGNGCNMDV